MIYDEINENDIVFNRDTISNREKQYEKQLNELQGDQLEKLILELEFQKLHL
jgi:5-bromo-4-chloroindolyl phosphate hydrolysis protein